MKKIVILLLSVFCFACKEDTEVNKKLVANALKIRELQLKNIANAWNFEIMEMSGEAQNLANNWAEWLQFISEIKQKPPKTIGSFQRKAGVLVQKSEVLPTSIPSILNKPQIKARLIAMITKLKTLATFIKLSAVPEQKIIVLLEELNTEIQVIQTEIEEIIVRSHIVKEEGEQEMLNNLKTAP